MNEPRPKNRLQIKITIYLVLLVILIINSVGWFLYYAADHYLDEELGKKLVSIAQFAAKTMEPDLLTYLQPGDENGQFYHSVQTQLKKLEHDFNLTRSYLIDPKFKILVDSEGKIAIGSPVVHLHPHLLELESTLQGDARYTILYRGNDDVYYKSAFAAIKTKDSTVTAIYCVDASPEFLQVLENIKNSIIFINSASFAIAVFISFFLAKSIANPVKKLMNATERMRRGDLTRPVEIKTRDEIGYLGDVFNSMQEAIRSQQEKLQNRIEEKERMAYLGELSAAVAHEIRNPLNSIELYMGLVKRQIGTETGATNNIEKIHLEIKALNSIVTSFLKFARQPAPEIKKINLNDIIQATLFLANKELKENDIEVHMNLGTKEIILWADGNQLKQAFLNIVLNSIQAMPKQGILTLSTEEIAEGEFVMLYIRDTGCGMPASDRDRIFQPFFSTKNRGTGLGLAIVKNIIEAHHGTIFVESEVQKGTIFSVKLPMDHK
ncbi:MAG: sensor histidine kinase [Calditrichaeota bacterium]|nr:MAG: sensor histidine kinase [Calditrichota bacterium]